MPCPHPEAVYVARDAEHLDVIIALQVHSGKDVKVSFRNIRL